MTQSMFDRICSELDYWFGVAEINREGPLTWRLTPNGNWPTDHSFGFQFSRDCLSHDTACQFRRIEGQTGYRLTFRAAILHPETHEQVLEAALWARLTGH